MPFLSSIRSDDLTPKPDQPQVHGRTPQDNTDYGYTYPYPEIYRSQIHEKKQWDRENSQSGGITPPQQSQYGAGLHRKQNGPTDRGQSVGPRVRSGCRDMLTA
jgi:hypothetical protein